MLFERKSSPRLKGFDYSQPGGYFVPICTAQRVCLFGEIIEGQMVLNPLGEIVLHAWMTLPTHYSHVKLDEIIVMPNHIHGIVMLLEDRRDRFRNLSLRGLHQQKRHGLSEIIRGFKTWSARRINQIQNTPGTPVWQRSFYDHIIRDDDDLNRIRSYIIENPLTWNQDRNNPKFLSSK
jgi:putative transposase